MTRQVSTITLTIANGAALSDAFELGGATLLTLHMPSAWTAADIGFQVSSTFGGTYQPLRDETGNLVQVSGPAASNSYILPAELSAALFLKLWSQSSGTGTNQGAERTITVDIKM